MFLDSQAGVILARLGFSYAVRSQVIDALEAQTDKGDRQ
jgi:hypothetical protein